MNNVWITKAEYIQDYLINIEFNDGVNGIVDLKDELDQPVFQSLKDVNYFKKFKLNSWTIEWKNGADFAPEFLYEKMQRAVSLP